MYKEIVGLNTFAHSFLLIQTIFTWFPTKSRLYDIDKILAKFEHLFCFNVALYKSIYEIFLCHWAMMKLSNSRGKIRLPNSNSRTNGLKQFFLNFPFSLVLIYHLFTAFGLIYVANLYVFLYYQTSGYQQMDSVNEGIAECQDMTLTAGQIRDRDAERKQRLRDRASHSPYHWLVWVMVRLAHIVRDAGLACSHQVRAEWVAFKKMMVVCLYKVSCQWEKAMKMLQQENMEIQETRIITFNQSMFSFLIEWI